MDNYNTYKCRAETYYDIEKFINVILPNLRQCTIVRQPGFPDCELTFTTNLSIQILKNILDVLPYCHVMEGTLQPEQYYTGERQSKKAI